MRVVFLFSVRIVYVQVRKSPQSVITNSHSAIIVTAIQLSHIAAAYRAGADRTCKLSRNFPKKTALILLQGIVLIVVSGIKS